MAIESLMSMKKLHTVSATPPPPAGPSALELSELKTARARGALKSWYRRLNELYNFKLMHGHCDVPQKYPENRCLGIWVNKQRCEKVMYEENAGHKTNLTPQKLHELEKVGFIWAKRKGDVIWNQRYTELVEFYNKHGHSDLPCKYKPNPTLGRWVTSQRSMYKRGILPMDYVEKLDEIGFTWDMYAKGNEENESSAHGERNEGTDFESSKPVTFGGSSSVVSNSDQEKKSPTLKRKRNRSERKQHANENNDGFVPVQDNLANSAADDFVGSTASKRIETYPLDSTDNDVETDDRKFLQNKSDADDDDNSTITEVTDDDISAGTIRNEV